MEFVCESELRSDAWNSAWKSLLGSCVDFRNCIADAATFDKTIVIGLSRGQGASLVHGKCPRGAGYEASHQPRVWTAASNPVPKNGISILGRPNHGRPHARPKCLSYKAPSGSRAGDRWCRCVRPCASLETLGLVLLVPSVSRSRARTEHEQFFRPCPRPHSRHRLCAFVEQISRGCQTASSPST